VKLFVISMNQEAGTVETIPCVEAIIAPDDNIKQRTHVWIPKEWVDRNDVVFDKNPDI
jgi:hypothetical protein